ncbi:MAG TPA: thiamine phosphate synthase [Acidimicrobiales bacterium]|nr:thiamine phosphate synthase [Acidimicrobiales bacterium]
MTTTPAGPPSLGSPSRDGSTGLGGPVPLGRLHVLVDTVELAAAALDGGAPTLQVRLKAGTDAARFRLAAAIAERCRAVGALCLVNDRADIAVAVGADGLHVGADDVPVAAVRRVVGSVAVVGGTARTPAVARRLVAEGASYVGVGPAYATASKDGLPDPIGLAGVRAVVEAVDVPVVAIAGITAARVPEVLATGAWGVAVIGAVAGADDPRSATRELAQAVDRAVGALAGADAASGARAAAAGAAAVRAAAGAARAGPGAGAGAGVVPEPS